jgi:hypothetical protein
MIIVRDHGSDYCAEVLEQQSENVLLLVVGTAQALGWIVEGGVTGAAPDSALGQMARLLDGHSERMGKIDGRRSAFC